MCYKSGAYGGVGYQTTHLGCAGIGVYVRSVNLQVTSLSTRSGEGSLALWLQRSALPLQILWLFAGLPQLMLFLPQFTTLSGHNYCL